MFKNFAYKNILVVGIGGIGISALAKLLVTRGYNIYGINDSQSLQTLDELRKMGVDILVIDKDDSELISKLDFKFDAIVYSAAWESNFPKLMEKLKSMGAPMFVYASALGKVSENFKLVTISGTHGKTTTTAMLCHILENCGKPANCIVGSLLKFSDGRVSNFKPADSDLLVIEACEYKRHFLNYHPDLAIITNIEFDHPDYYKDEQDFLSAFKEFKSQAKKVIDLENINMPYTQIPKLKVPGEHNKKNAALAVSAAMELGVDKECAVSAIVEFPGTWRRLEFKGYTPKGAMVFDDYAHHPSEIKATLSAVVQEFKDKKIIAVFEPHTYSRTKTFFNDFVSAFSELDVEQVYFAPTYPAREKPISGADAQDLAKAVPSAEYKRWPDLKKVLSNYNEDYVIVLMGAGDMYKLADELVKI